MYLRKKYYIFLTFSRLCTPDYKDQKFETEKTKPCNTSFLSLKRPDFKYVIFEIVEVSPRNPPAKQHSRFGPIPPKGSFNNYVNR